MPEHPHHIRSEAYKYRFDLLFASLLCTIVVNIFFPEDIYDGIAQTIYLPIQLIAGITLFDIRRKGYLLTLLIFLGGLLIVGRLLDSFTPLNLREYLVFAYVVFFGWVTLELFRQIYTAPLVDRESVLAALCGLLLIGYCGFFIFVAVEFHQPGSFSGLTPGGQGFRDLFYFSYVDHPDHRLRRHHAPYMGRQERHHPRGLDRVHVLTGHRRHDRQSIRGKP